MNFLGCVVPVECDVNVLVASPVRAEGIIVFKNRFEGQGMFFANELDIKIVYYLFNPNGVQAVFSKPRY